jgi:hypothetical protein
MAVVSRRRTNPDEEPQRTPSAARARQNWLTSRRCASWRRIDWVPLTAIATSHLREWSAHRHRRTYRSAHRHRSAYWSTGWHRRTHRHRRTYRSTYRHRSSHGCRRNRRNRPRQSHRNTSHVSDWSASRTARCRRRTCGLAGLRLDACVAAAGWQRDGRNVRAQRHCDPAQPSPSSNYPDVESIQDRHRRRTLRLRSDIPLAVTQQNRMPY